MKYLLNYEIEFNSESADWVVFLHGAGGSIATWKYQRDLKQRFNLLFLDLRDHGKSKNITPAYNKYNFEIITNDIIVTLKQLSISEAHFVTLSFGSVLIQNIMLKKPYMVKKSVVSGAIFSGSIHLKLFVHTARFLNLFLPFQKMYEIFSWILMPRSSEQLSRRVYAMQARKLSNLEYLKWLGLYSQFFLMLRKYINHNLSSKTLVLMGENDYMFLPAAKKFVSLQDNATLEVIKKAGHICNIDQAQTFNERVIKFLVS